MRRRRDGGAVRVDGGKLGATLPSAAWRPVPVIGGAHIHPCCGAEGRWGRCMVHVAVGWGWGLVAHTCSAGMRITPSQE